MDASCKRSGFLGPQSTRSLSRDRPRSRNDQTSLDQSGKQCFPAFGSFMGKHNASDTIVSQDFVCFSEGFSHTFLEKSTIFGKAIHLLHFVLHDFARLGCKWVCWLKWVMEYWMIRQ